MSVPLTNTELTSLRSAVNGHLPDTARRLRRRLVSDGAGGQTETWDPVSGTVRCALLVQTGRNDRLEGGQASATMVRDLVLPAGTEIASDDRWRIGDETYAVVDADPDRSNPVQVRATVRRL